MASPRRVGCDPRESVRLEPDFERGCAKLPTFADAALESRAFPTAPPPTAAVAADVVLAAPSALPLRISKLQGN